MNDRTTEAKQIPDAPYYVTMTDRFLSGWGRAENAKARYIYPCENYAEAKHVELYALGRKDQSYVKICRTKPKLNKHDTYMLANREDSSAWYPAK